MTPVVIDIETVKPTGVLLDHALSRVKVGNRKDPEKVEAYLQEKSARFSLDIRWARIACIGVRAGDDRILFDAWSATEHEMLRQFVVWMQEREPIAWCGHNIRAFDLPVIRTRLLAHGFGAYADAFVFKRYDKERVRDTVEDWWVPAPLGVRWSLADLCAVLGVEKPWGKGSQVGEWWESGDFESIGRHCLSDVDCEWEVAKTLGVW